MPARVCRTVTPVGGVQPWFVTGFAGRRGAFAVLDVLAGLFLTVVAASAAAAEKVRPRAAIKVRREMFTAGLRGSGQRGRRRGLYAHVSLE